MLVDSTSEKGVRISNITVDGVTFKVQKLDFVINDPALIQTAHAGELCPPIWPDPFELRTCLLYRPFFRCYPNPARSKQPGRQVCQRR